MTPPADPFRLLGSVLDSKYRVDRVLGEGGFGVVYGGVHLAVGQPIAIKCLKPVVGTAEQQQRMIDLFQREARVLFTLTHPGIVRLYDVGSIDLASTAGSGAAGSAPYVVLEYIAGRSLEDEIAARRASGGPHFTAPQLRTVFDQVLDALSFAHERGVTHRDIKPSNVMLSGDGDRMSAKLVDFGIARVAESGGTTTTAGAFTPRYAAPEQWDPTLGAAGPAIDVWAMGLTLAEAAMLAPMLPGNSVSELVLAVMDPSRRVGMGRSRPDLPTAVDAVVSRATRVAPADRFAHAREMREALARAWMGYGVAATQPAIVVSASYPPVAAMGGFPAGNMSSSTSPTAFAPTSYSSSQPSVQSALPPNAAPRPRSPMHVLMPVLAACAVVLFAVIGVAGYFGWRAYSNSILPILLTPPPKTASRSTSALPAPPLPSNLPKPKGHVLLTTINCSGPFWNAGDIDPVARARLGELDLCFEQNIDRKNKKQQVIDVVVTPDKTGRVEAVVCDLQGDDETAEELSMCTCMQAKVSQWRFPPSHGSVGLLEAGPVVLEFKARYR